MAYEASGVEAVGLLAGLQDPAGFECREGPQGKSKVRTGLGKTHRPGLQGGLWKRDATV